MVVQCPCNCEPVGCSNHFIFLLWHVRMSAVQIKQVSSKVALFSVQNVLFLLLCLLQGSSKTKVFFSGQKEVLQRTMMLLHMDMSALYWDWYWYEDCRIWSYPLRFTGFKLHNHNSTFQHLNPYICNISKSRKTAETGCFS